jgi:hypothetical protein
MLSVVGLCIIILSNIMLSVVMLSVVGLSVITLSVIMLSFVMLSVVGLSVITLSVKILYCYAVCHYSEGLGLSVIILIAILLSVMESFCEYSY